MMHVIVISGQERRRLLAALIPARRATRIDPAQVMRAE
jgi:ABC-type lipoprotein release transport system permease subunit